MKFVDSCLEPGEAVRYRARVRAAAYIMPTLWAILLLAVGGVTGLLTTELALTDRRVIVRRGMFRRRRLIVLHKQIGSVLLRQGMLGKLLDYGTITLSSVEGERIILKGIAEPVDVQLQLEEAAEMAVLGRRLLQTVIQMQPEKEEGSRRGAVREPSGASQPSGW